MRRYETIIIPGAGDIIASAIKKTSKNNYYTYLIRRNPNFATEISHNSLKEAKAYIAKEYGVAYFKSLT